MDKIFEYINCFRTGYTAQHYRRDISPVYENEYLKLVRIDSSNKAGGKDVVRGKQWSIIFELKNHLYLLMAGNSFAITMVMMLK